MTTGYANKVGELYRETLANFVAERTRLAAELKAEGDPVGAKRLIALHRPPLSAWVVNQLYWQARPEFEAWLATGAQLRRGEIAASATHREATSRLRRRAAQILQENGHAANEDTLRRATATLAALAATGTFDPDPPGALSADREPPGFDGLPAPIFQAAPPPPPAPAIDPEVERRRLEALRVARERQENALRVARAELQDREREVEAHEAALHAARRAVQESRDTLARLERDEQP